jgi:hypothetical protein
LRLLAPKVARQPVVSGRIRQIDGTEAAMAFSGGRGRLTRVSVVLVLDAVSEVLQ